MCSLPDTYDEVMALQSAPRGAVEQVTIKVTPRARAATRSARARGGQAAETAWLVAHSLSVTGDAAQLIREAYQASSPLALLPPALLPEPRAVESVQRGRPMRSSPRSNPPSLVIIDAIGKNNGIPSGGDP